MRGRDGGGCPEKQATPLLALMKEGERVCLTLPLLLETFFSENVVCRSLHSNTK